MEELANVIRDKFPDVRVDREGTVLPEHGIVVMEIDWDFQEGRNGDARTYKHIGILARVATGEIAITRADGLEVLSAAEWTNRENLEGAVVRAYSQPTLKS